MRKMIFPVLLAGLMVFSIDARAESQEPYVKITVEGTGKNTKGNGDSKLEAKEAVRLQFAVVNPLPEPLTGHRIVFEGTEATFSPAQFKLPTIPSRSQVRGETLVTLGGSPAKLRVTATIAPASGNGGYATTFVLRDNTLVAETDVPPPAEIADTPTDSQKLATIPEAVDELAKQVLLGLPKQGFADAVIAVSPFVNLGATAAEKKLGQIVAELLVTRLTERPNLRIIERSQIEAILEELKLSMLGLTESSNAEKVGKLLGAEAMIVGSVSEVGDQFAISARHIDVATGKVLFAKEVLLPQAGAIALSTKYIVTRSRSDAFFRSLVMPGWGQIYNNQDAKGYVLLGTTAALIGVGVFQRMQYGKTHDAYMGATNRADADRLYERRNSEYNSSNLFFLLAGGVWVANAVEAFVSGTSRSDVEVPQEEKANASTSFSPMLGVSGDAKVAGLELRF